MIQRVTVYCSSSASLDPVYRSAATDLGAAIARAGWRLVYGGNAIGLMKTLADAARSAGGTVMGITTRHLDKKGTSDSLADEMVIAETLAERKTLLRERGDGFIALPGGLGTLDELFDLLAGRQLREHDKPVVLLNIDDYYRPLLEMIERGIDQGFIKERARTTYFVTDQVDHAIAYLREMGELNSVRQSTSPLKG